MNLGGRIIEAAEAELSAERMVRECGSSSVLKRSTRLRLAQLPKRFRIATISPHHPFPTSVKRFFQPCSP